MQLTEAVGDFSRANVDGLRFRQQPDDMSSFLILCFLLTITPGADTALVLRSSLSAAGPRSYFPTVVGICAGLLFHATISSLGLSVILVKSAQLFSIVKLCGAAYLIYLGTQTLWTARKPVIVDVAPARAGFRSGFLTNILNPKVAVFYLTFLPQFIDVHANAFIQSIALASIHIAMCLVWLSLVGEFVLYFRAQLEKPSVRRVLDSLTGLALLGFGVKLALSRD